MPNEVVAIIIKGIMPTANGCAVFLGNEDKTFVIYVDHSVGNALQMALNGVKKERPLTHDLIGHVLLGLGARIEHAVINDVQEGTFFARLLIRMENELGKKVIEIDARPSDSLVLVVQSQRPMYVLRSVLEKVEDMTEVLERVTKQPAPGDAAAADDAEEGDEADESDDEDDDEDEDFGEDEEDEEGGDDFGGGNDGGKKGKK